MRTADELKFAAGWKLKWARHHINKFVARSNAFLAERPFTLMERHQRKAGKTTYRVKVEKTMLPEFSLIIGDAIHNMRAALDIVLFEMAGHVEPKIAFPFPDKPDTIKAAIKERKVRAAGEKVVEAITRLQPYPTGEHLLYFIHALDIQDKHRLLILAGQRAVFTTGSGNDKILGPMLREYPKPGVNIILDGPEETNLVTIRRPYVTRDLPDSENEAKVQPAFTITFGETEIFSGNPVVNILRGLTDEAEAAVDAIIAAFLDPANNRP